MRLDWGISRLKVYLASERVPTFNVMIQATASRLRQAEADWTSFWAQLSSVQATAPLSRNSRYFLP